MLYYPHTQETNLRRLLIASILLGALTIGCHGGSSNESSVLGTCNATVQGTTGNWRIRFTRQTSTLQDCRPLTIDEKEGSTQDYTDMTVQDVRAGGVEHDGFVMIDTP